MRSRRDFRDDQPDADHGSAAHVDAAQPRHSDVVPRAVGNRDYGDVLLGGPSHLSWPELRSLRVPDEARAILEVTESMLHGELGKDLCLRIADNLVDEAYERVTADRRFDSYYFCHCAAAVARLSARIRDTNSTRDAIEAMQSAVAALWARGIDGELPTLELAARMIRDELSQRAQAGVTAHDGTHKTRTRARAE